MTKSQKITVVTMFILVFLSISYVITTNQPKEPETSEAEAPKVTKAEPCNYRVMEFDGKIAVFYDGHTVPLYTLESPYIRDLPKYDQELLRTGIIAKDNTELLEILEDYDN